MDREYVLATLRFWEVLADERLTGDAAKTLEDDIHAKVAAMDADTRKAFGDIARRQYAEQETTRASVASRGATFMLFVGVILTGATVVGASLATTNLLVIAVILIDGFFLLYASLAVAFLAVRAQGVTMWVAPAMYPKDAPDAPAIAIKEVVENAFAYQQNKSALRNLVAYLADAQRWARRAVILVVILAALSVAAAATKPTPATPVQAQSQPPIASTAPAASSAPAGASPLPPG